MCTAANKGNKVDAGCFQITYFAWWTIKTLNGIRLIIIWIRIKLRLLKWRHLSFGKNTQIIHSSGKLLLMDLHRLCLLTDPNAAYVKVIILSFFSFSNDLIKAQCVEKQWSGNSSLCHKPSWRIKRIVVTPKKQNILCFICFHVIGAMFEQKVTRRQRLAYVCGQLDLSKVFFPLRPLIK